MGRTGERPDPAANLTYPSWPGMNSPQVGHSPHPTHAKGLAHGHSELAA
ncbi:predicted protein [Streptomyces filamentosus NRRL 15998]|uniref:Predicted protein n=1 Tax=Streptomyces filamentosus NRRL 15998 TaxID=457431 RepID=D6ARL0_STRFL|nr:predicted protein [Streptomyces filamentosus NRRL 15998]